MSSNNQDPGLCLGIPESLCDSKHLLGLQSQNSTKSQSAVSSQGNQILMFGNEVTDMKKYFGNISDEHRF